MEDSRRCFTLSPAQIAAINPNTKTAPVFRSRRDAELTAAIYDRVPVLIEEAKGDTGNPWGIKLRTMFHKSGAAKDGDIVPAIDLAVTSDTNGDFVPCYEGDYGHQFDHRFSTFEHGRARDATFEEHVNPSFEPTLEWVGRKSAARRALERWNANPDRSTILAFRRVARSTDLRTTLACILPSTVVANSWIVTVDLEPARQAVLCANYNSLVFDLCLRNSLSQPSIPQSTFEQTATIPPAAYDEVALAFIVPRVLELTYTSHSMAPFARDLGHEGPPFEWDEDRRAQLRAELDAWYALAYGLTRDELRYVLDPKDVMGEDYPSETFRVLQKNEIAKYSEYRTQRLVLAAYDTLVAGGMRPRTEGYK